MPDAIEPLILDFVAWVAKAPRPYGEAIEAWRTSCPRLTVWEEALERGFLRREAAGAEGALLTVTAAGRRFLAANQRRADAAAPVTAPPGTEREIG